MSKGKSESTHDRAVLLRAFRHVENCLRDVIGPGLPRCLEVVNLLFLKLMAERGRESFWAELKGAQGKISYLNEVIIPTLQAKYQAHKVFTETKIADDKALEKIVTLLDGLHLTDFDTDVLGDAYEYFLKRNPAAKQTLGQYFTPRPLVKAMVDLVVPTTSDTIYDPFCGTGGLLIGTFNYIKEKGNPKETPFFGKDVCAPVRLAKMNAILHWGTHGSVEAVENTLQHPVSQKYSIGLANVPFARDLNNYPYDGLYENGLAKKKTDVLAILHLFQAIHTGGRLAAIVPEGFLFGKERAEARRFLTDNADLRLVVSLPHGMFLPYTQVKTAIIYLENIHCPTQKDDYWYFDVQNGGDSSSPALLHLSNLHKASENDLTSLGYVKVPFDKLRHHDENWIGKHYHESSGSPSLYPLVSLGELVSFMSTGVSFKANQLAQEGTPLFTLKSIKKDFPATYETRFLKYETQTSQKNICLEGDLLVALKDKNREAPILGRATVANQKGVFCADLAKVGIKSKDRLSSEYLSYCLKSEPYLKEIQRFSTGSIVKSISLENIASIKIPLPSLSAQQNVVRELSQYEKLIVSHTKAANDYQEKCRERLQALWR